MDTAEKDRDGSDPELGEWQLRRLITDVAGSRPKSANNVTRQRACERAARVCAGESTDAVEGAAGLGPSATAGGGTQDRLAALREF